MLLYTIGHSNHPIDKFTGLLQGHTIAQLVDVRSIPYSRINPQYNQKALRKTLLEHEIAYAYQGDALGGRPKDAAYYIQGAILSKTGDLLHKVDYPLVMQQPWFIQGIQDLLTLAGNATTCILCSEKDPAGCHRHHLIARYLMQVHPEVTIWHILADGSLVNAADIATRDDAHNAGQLAFKV